MVNHKSNVVIMQQTVECVVLECHASYPASYEIEFEEACLSYLSSSLKMLLEGITTGKGVGAVCPTSDCISSATTPVFCISFSH